MKKSRFWNGVMLFVLFVSMAGCASQVFSEVKESASVTKKFGDMVTYSSTHINNPQSGCSVIITDVKFEYSITPEGLIQSTVENKPPFPATLKSGDRITASVKIFTKENCTPGELYVRATWIETPTNPSCTPNLNNQSEGRLALGANCPSKE